MMSKKKEASVRRLFHWMTVLFLFGVLGFPGSAASFFGGDEVRLKMQEYLDAACRFWNFQGSVLAAKNGRVILKAGYGLADVDGQIPITPETKFLIASVTKTFTAAAVMMLEEEGFLELNDPIGKYLKEYPPETASRITVHHLLSHTSGIPEAAADPGSLGDLARPRTPGELVALFKDKPLEFEPGTKSRYSNSGYIVLGQIIESVSGKPYYDFVRERIFLPLGMKKSGVCAGERPLPRSAAGYVEGRDGRLMKVPVVHPSLGYSAGAFCSTVGDLLKWDRGLHAAKVLPRASLERMFNASPGGFGYGWLIMEAWGRRSIAHGGGAPGFASWIERWPEEKVFIAVLSNNGRTPAGEIGRSLAAILFGRAYEIPRPLAAVSLSTDVLDEYVGTYRIDDRNTRRIIRQGRALFVERGGQRYPIVPIEKDRFFFPHDRGASIRFIRDRAGVVTGHVFHQLGVDKAAEKLSDLLDRKDDRPLFLFAIIKGPRREGVPRRDVDKAIDLLYKNRHSDVRDFWGKG